MGCSSGICLKFPGFVTSPYLHEAPDNSLDLLLHNLFPLLRMGEELTVGWKEVRSFRDPHCLGPSDFSGCRKVRVGRGQVTIRNHYYVNITGKLPSVSSVTQSHPALCNPMDCSTSLSVTNSQSLLTLMSIKSVMPSNHLILCRRLLLLPSIFPSIRVFSNESALHIRWPKYGSLSFSISPSNEHPGLISFRMNWLDLLAIQGTLKSLLQHHSSKA